MCPERRRFPAHHRNRLVFFFLFFTRIFSYYIKRYFRNQKKVRTKCMRLIIIVNYSRSKHANTVWPSDSPHIWLLLLLSHTLPLQSWRASLPVPALCLPERTLTPSRGLTFEPNRLARSNMRLSAHMTLSSEWTLSLAFARIAIIKQGSHIREDWPHMGQIRDFFRWDFSVFWLERKCTKIWSEKSQICPIWGDSDLLWTKNWSLCNQASCSIQDQSSRQYATSQLPVILQRWQNTSRGWCSW